MKTYIKPAVQVVELSVKENISLLENGVQDFGFGANNQNTFKLKMYAANTLSANKVKEIQKKTQS